MWHFITGKCRIQKFCLLASCTSPGPEIALCSFMIESFMECAACQNPTCKLAQVFPAELGMAILAHLSANINKSV
jgi:hypothetical protein